MRKINSLEFLFYFSTYIQRKYYDRKKTMLCFKGNIYFEVPRTQKMG